MDICKYIPSKAITAHIKEIGHKFTLPEKAAIIYHNNHMTLNEKFAGNISTMSADGITRLSVTTLMTMDGEMGRNVILQPMRLA